VERLVVAAVLVAIAVVAAALLDRRRRPDAPSQPGWAVPAQLDRADFPRPDAPWLVAVFTSVTCDSCRGTIDKARVLDCEEVAVFEAEVGTQAELHRRYAIEAVPITVIADGAGVVHASFVGPVTATDLWAAVAEAREPGSTPEPDLGH